MVHNENFRTIGELLIIIQNNISNNSQYKLSCIRNSLVRQNSRLFGGLIRNYDKENARMNYAVDRAAP